MNQFDIDPKLDLFAEIEQLKKEHNAVIFAHYYQDPDIQDVADLVGDSLQLAQEAKNTNADQIVLCGVHFMAETAKMLSPNKKVLLPDLKAGCSLADSCPIDAFKLFRDENPDHLVVTYVNSTADVKALTDICVTSTNAEKVIRSIPANKKIIFAPDKNLGRYLIKKTGRDMLLWNGSCMVHEIFSEKELMRLKVQNPNASIIAHPECEEHILNHADFVGSTSALLNFVKSDSSQSYIVLTEEGIIHQMKKAEPEKNFIPALTDDLSCSCNQCPHMKLNTLEKLYLCLKNQSPEVILDDKLMRDAVRCIDKMLEIS